MNRAQYDDVYVEWLEAEMFIDLNNQEDEECYVRHLHRLHH